MTAEDKPPSPVRGGTIVVIDDDREIRDTVQDVLEDEKFSVVTLRNGAEALEYLRTSARPALILLDLSMPVMDGAAFREAQRSDPKIADIPVVAFSAAAGLGARVRSLDLAGCLRKPLRLQELLATAKRFANPRP